MLSKSQAKQFFIFGTVICASAFLLLTLDTLKRIPAQTHSDHLTESAIRGKHIFESNNCMGCHTILGEGAYYAPELTKVVERRGVAFIKQLIRDPQAMYPGQRKMVKYNFNESELDDLVAFFQWIGEIDLNGFPAKPNLMQSASPNIGGGAQANSLIDTTNRPKIFNQMCVACHSLRGQGGMVGPALDGVGDRRPSEEINRWLHDPTSVKADSKMPKLPLSEEDIVELTAFLSQLKGTQK